MHLSVVIPCYNAADTIAAQLEALVSQRWTKPWEVIISDNGSNDELPAVVERFKEKLPNLRVVDSSDRRGAAHARNVGALAAIGEALAFCDADDEVAPGWVAAIGAALSEHDFVASRFDIEKLNTTWVQKSHANPQRDGLNQYRYPPYLPHAGGSGLGVKRALHQTIGGFDESMPILEDTDYCWRIQLAGTELHFVPNAVIHVRYPDTFCGIFRQARGYAEHNVLLYKRYRTLGMPKLSWRKGVAAWARLLRRLLRIRSKGDLAACVWQLGWRIGRLQGCIKHRVLAL
ncbi:MAG TPA: glycosyltransferase [Anaerolineae bacterium]|nr:glycosyltransferase [Anaerolineae bacterium]